MKGSDARVSVIVVAYNHKKYLADCVRSLEKSDLPPGQVRLILVDNASSDGTADFVRSELMNPDGAATKGGLPATFIANSNNLGFSGGNNLAIRQALADGDTHVYLLNPDTEVEPDFLTRALETMGSDPGIAVVQSLLRLHPDRDLVNSWGNEIHFLGFGYAGGESVPASDPSAAPKLRVRDIAYASGAGMLIRADALRKIGFLNEELFAYHEDLEFSWRARLAGYRIALSPESVVYHKYEFSRSIKKWYLMERNRFLVMAWCYAWPSLLINLPALAAMELGLWLFAIKGGWWKEKARAYGYVLNPVRWGGIIAARREVQALRTATDRTITRLFTGKIEFQRLSSPMLTVANLPFILYWRAVRLIMFW